MKEIGSQAILVLGMHRSGTSALTGLLSLLGLDVGNSLLPPAGEVNPRGFWEHSGIVDIHDRLLGALGSSWHDERDLPNEWWARPAVLPFKQELESILLTDFADARTWVVKDPRLCRLFPMWRSLFETRSSKPKIVIIMRDPREVAQSLTRRDGIFEERAHLLWLQHILDAERWTRDYVRTVVTFEGLLTDWRSTIDQINSELRLSLLTNEPGTQQRVEAFLEPSLRHHKCSQPPFGRVARLAVGAYQACANALPSSQLRSILTPVAVEKEQVQSLVSSWSDEIQALAHMRAEFATYKATAEALAREVTRIKNSVSWRITAPVRAVWNIFRERKGE